MTGMTLWQRIQLAVGLRLSAPAPVTPRIDPSRAETPPEEYFAQLRLMRETWVTVLNRIEAHVGRASLAAIQLGIPCDQLAALLYELDRLQRIGTNTIADLIQEKHAISSDHWDTIHELHNLKQHTSVLERKLADSSTPPDALRKRREHQLALVWDALDRLQRVADQVISLWTRYYAFGSTPPEVQSVMRDMIDKAAGARRALNATEGAT